MHGTIGQVCSEAGCDRKSFGRGLCGRHYQRLRFEENKKIAIPDGGKECKKCKEDKPFSEFVRHASCKDGFRQECRGCMSDYQKVKRVSYRGVISRRYSLKKNYGLSIEQYDRMLEDQKGKCAICAAKRPPDAPLSFFHVDHDHQTGVVRGLLCGPCNTGIGMLKDDPKVLRKAIKYLLKRST